MSIKVLLADEHPVVFEGIVAANQDFNIGGCVASIDELVNSLTSDPPHVLISEVRLSGHDALKSIGSHREQHPDLKVVVFSGCDNPIYIARAAAIGCHEFISKSEPVQRLFQAVIDAANNVAPPEDSSIVCIGRKMCRTRPLLAHDVALTNREMQVLQHIATGLSNREIGKSLEISIETVKEHVQNILRKLDLNDRTQAAIWAVKRDLA